MFVPPPQLSRPGRRGARATAVLLAVAILLFVVAAGGGFALARTVGGESLLPPDAEPRGTSNGPTQVPPPALVHQTGDASYATGSGGQFGLDVPDGWQKFVAPHNTRFGVSTVVQYVSPDGRRSLRLERMEQYLPKHSTDEYLDYLRQSYPEEAFELFPPEALPDDKGTTADLPAGRARHAARR